VTADIATMLSGDISTSLGCGHVILSFLMLKKCKSKQLYFRCLHIGIMILMGCHSIPRVSVVLPSSTDCSPLFSCSAVFVFGWKWSIDGFHSIFSLWQLEGKGSCDVDIDQSADSIVM